MTKAKAFLTSNWTTKKIAIVGGASGGSLLLLVAVLVIAFSGGGQSGGGKESAVGGKGGYTQAVLDLDPNLLKKSRDGRPVRPGTKPEYAPGTVADLLQAITILSGFDLRGMSSKSNVLAKYGSLARVNLPIPVWNKVFGTPENVKKNVKLPGSVIHSDVWTIKCKDGAVVLVGDIRPDADVAQGGLILVQGVNWDQYLKAFCAEPPPRDED